MNVAFSAPYPVLGDGATVTVLPDGDIYIKAPVTGLAKAYRLSFYMDLHGVPDNPASTCDFFRFYGNSFEFTENPTHPYVPAQSEDNDKVPSALFGPAATGPTPILSGSDGILDTASVNYNPKNSVVHYRILFHYTDAKSHFTFSVDPKLSSGTGPSAAPVHVLRVSP